MTVYKDIGRFRFGAFEQRDVKIGFHIGYDAWAHDFRIAVYLPFLMLMVGFDCEGRIRVKGANDAEQRRK